MKAILIDITRCVVRTIKHIIPTGIDRVMLAYIQHYKTSAQAVISIRGYCFILSRAVSEKVFAALLSDSVMHWKIYLLIIQEIILSFFKPLPCGYLLNLSHMGIEFDRYPYFAKRQKIKNIYMLHDLIPITHPEYCRPISHTLHLAKINQVLNKAHGIITNSLVTLNQLVIYATNVNKPLPPAIFASLACRKLVKTQARQLITVPYFVMVGTIEGRKNHYLILQIWRKLIDSLGSRAPKLVIIGRRGWECEQVINLLDHCYLLKEYVIECEATDAEVMHYLQHARALLFPSFAEGYGIPLIEALSLNVPVIASNLPVFYEIAKDIPEYLDPLDGKAWLELIIEYTKLDSELRNHQLLRIASFKGPTWQQHFTKVAIFLERLSS